MAVEWLESERGCAVDRGYGDDGGVAQAEIHIAEVPSLGAFLIFLSCAFFFFLSVFFVVCCFIYVWTTNLLPESLT